MPLLPILLAPPTLSLLLSITTATLTLAFTLPSSLPRFAALPLMLTYVYIGARPSSPSPYSHPLYANLTGGSLMGMTLKYIDLALLSAWDADAEGPTSGAGGLSRPLNADEGRRRRSSSRREGKGTLEKVFWAFALIFNSRLLGTPWEVKRVPPFSTQEPNWVPSRRRFAAVSAAKALTCFVLLDAIRFLPASTTEQNQELFAPERVGFFSRLGQVTVEEVVLRYVAAAMFGIVTFLLFQGVHCGCGAILVGVGVSEVASWRPCFGSVGEGWTLRGFWGAYWHQGLRQNLGGLAGFVTYEVSSLGRGGLLGRYLNVMLIFLLSGGLHVFGDIAAGLDWHESGVIQYFATQALGLFIEDAVQATYHYAVRPEKRTHTPGPVQRFLGFVWVLTFMAWSVPVYTYPTSRRDRGQGVLPIRILS